MQVTETLHEGLKREFKVVVTSTDLQERLMKRLWEAKDKVKLNGFRPGKVPVQHLRKMYGKSFMAEVVNEIVTDSARTIPSGRGERVAMQPDVSMTEDETEAEKILAGNADFTFQVAYEVLPPIELKDVTGIAVTREVFDVPAEDVEEQARRVAESARTWAAKDGAAEDGDRVTIDFVGKIDGVPFENGAADDAQLVIGSGQFIPGFEEQLVGVVSGDERVLNVSFPEGYGAAHLAGKAATFDVTVKSVEKANELVIDDEVAKSLGLESAERLREIVRRQLESQYGALTRQKVKRELLDRLDEMYKFDAPSKLVQAEFDNIWNQVNRDLQAANRTFADEDTTEDEARAEYTRLAERRVRLGLVLAEFGEKAAVNVTDEELQRAMFEYVRRFPGQEEEIYRSFRENPQALVNFRAPLFEEKVVDHLLTQIAVTDKPVSKEELLADPDEETSKPKQAAEQVAAAEGEEAEPKTARSKSAKSEETVSEGEDAPAKKKAAPRKKAAKETDEA